MFNRAVEVDWIGRSLASVVPTWSSNDTASCQFAAMAFPPSDEVLDEAVRRTTYLGAFHTISQCSSYFGKNNQPLTCFGDFGIFGGTLGGMTPEECAEEAAGGNYVKLWLDKNIVDGAPPLKCLERLFAEDASIGQGFDLPELRAAAANWTNAYNHTEHGHLFRFNVDHGLGEGDAVWHTLMFVRYVKVVLAGLQDEQADARLLAVESATDRLLSVLLDGRNTTSVGQCINDLVPPITKGVMDRIWRERGVYLQKSTMADSPSSLLRSFSGSLRGVLPPPPTVVYGKNAILGVGQMVATAHAPFETYFPGCTAWWNAISKEQNAVKGFGLVAKELGVSSAHAFGDKGLIEMCSGDKGNGSCPFPTYDLVVELFQSYCSGVFHYFIEIFPRIAPFLDALLSSDVHDFAIRNGCGTIKHFVTHSFELVGINTSKVKILNDTTVFAEEVIVPTEGFSHSPLLNYWNIVSLRRHVERHLGPIPSFGSKKMVLVIVRDASSSSVVQSNGRGDKDIYNEQFLKTLGDGLPNYNVTTFRSSDDALMTCLKCQVRAFMAADVIIGSHGAGLSHVAFAKAGCIVLERIASPGDSGIYAELPFLLGMKYFPIQAKATAEAYRDIILYADRQ